MKSFQKKAKKTVSEGKSDTAGVIFVEKTPEMASFTKTYSRDNNEGWVRRWNFRRFDPRKTTRF